MHQVAELAHVVRPRVIAQAILRGDAEAPEGESFAVDHPVDVIAQQVGHVLRVFAQRRHAHDEHVEVRQQVAAQRLAAGALLDSRLRGGDEARAQRHRLGSTPHAHELSRLEHAVQQPLHARGQILDLVNEERAAASLLEQALLADARRLAAEQAALRIRLAQCARDQRDERLGRVRAVLVHVARKGFASRARLADEQQRRGVGRYLLQLGAQLLHQAALADRRGECSAEQFPRLAVAPAGIERALHGAQQLGERQRLLDEVEGPEARGLDRRLDGAVPGHHDDRAAVGDARGPFAQQRDAVDVGHPDVQQHEIGDLPRARGARLRGVGGDVHLVAFLGEDLLQQAADVRLVIDHENVWVTHALSLRI